MRRSVCKKKYEERKDIMAQPKKLALSPFFILLYIHLALNIFFSVWFVARNEAQYHKAFLRLAIISTFVLLFILLIVAVSSKFSNTSNLTQVLKNKGVIAVLFILLPIHFGVSFFAAIESSSWLCAVSAIDILLMIVFLILAVTKKYV